MTSRTIIPNAIPRHFIQRPDFKRGSMGIDKGQFTKEVSGDVIDRKQHDKICNFSKTAHFNFHKHSKPLFLCYLALLVQIKERKPRTACSTTTKTTQLICLTKVKHRIGNEL